jgi:hypothetical protein
MSSRDDDHVLLTTFANSVEANLARDLLENAGMSAFVSDDQIMTNHPLLGSAVGGVKLWVRESDAADAVDALEEAPDEVFEAEDSVADLEPSDRLPASVPTCPACAGQDIGFGTPLFLFIAVMIVSVAIPYVTPLSTSAGCLITGVIFFIGQWLFIMRVFPLRCKECGETGKRAHFEGNYAREQ